ncbi:MAG: phosphoribosylformylglycinamidine synthase [Gammaproteobacteria bacterium]|nr:phosphoribosylformylglycinamidine synthase [Gammaproteobacteria bacterium]
MLPGSHRPPRDTDACTRAAPPPGTQRRLRGARALSPFRREGLLRRLRETLPELRELWAEYVYFAYWRQPPSPDQGRRLRSLLAGAQAPLDAPIPAGGPPLLALPRALSPWCSKATEIAQNCGLSGLWRLERATAWYLADDSGAALAAGRSERAAPLLHDRMTQWLAPDSEQAASLLLAPPPGAPGTDSGGAGRHRIAVLEEGVAALERLEAVLPLGLGRRERRCLAEHFRRLGRNPTDVELMTFAQFHSEHCRHQTFNACWEIDGRRLEDTPFALIRRTAEAAGGGRVLSAYRDNAAVCRGYKGSRFFPDASGRYARREQETHILMKVETHNHPTAICPHPGAATGAGGEIRDEAATGRGARPAAGLVGFSVSQLRIPGFAQPWEAAAEPTAPPNLASALRIMLEAPVGAASYNNEFGRPALCGYFRSFEQRMADGRVFGYRKPVMLAGGHGCIRADSVRKPRAAPGDLLVVLGGPAMRIGLGGGSASSQAAGTGDADSDYASVQRANAEMQRRCQEVIDRCCELGERNPIRTIHDVGAGGLANAVPELLAGRGAVVSLAQVPSADPGLLPLEHWCNEAQERYLLAMAPASLPCFEERCRRERAPFAVIGTVREQDCLRLEDARGNGAPPLELSMQWLHEALPPARCRARRRPRPRQPLDLAAVRLEEAAERVLRLPVVGDKSFLITIGDRTVGGLTARDPMVGPWQVPVADCAVTAASYDGWHGAAMALGERAPVALLDPAAAARLAVAEAVTNICAARILSLADIALSANWLAARGAPGMDADLYDAVRALSLFCRQLGIAVPVGKDSLSMHAAWRDAGGRERAVLSPSSAVVSAFAPVADIRRTLTPELRADAGETVLLLLELGPQRRLGGSALAQAYGCLGAAAPDVADAAALRRFARLVQLLNETGDLLAYHDRSDGGLFAALCEMAFASRRGIDLELDPRRGDPLAQLFCEEIGAVVQVPAARAGQLLALFAREARDSGLAARVLGAPADGLRLRIRHGEKRIYDRDILALQRCWAESGYRLRLLRDCPECARQEYARLQDRADPGLFARTGAASVPAAPAPAFAIAGKARPRLAVLREQGVNGHIELAAAFDRAGFDCLDVHMSDLLAGRQSLRGFHGMAAGGGFSYGDVLGAGGGWAGTILHNDALRREFADFFAREDTFTLGVCNGCQMLSRLAELIPGAQGWPLFFRNASDRFESRLVMVEVLPSRSVLLAGMAGWQLPVPVAHGEGRAAHAALPSGRVCLRYIDHRGRPAEAYPLNPNGSPGGGAGFASDDGRVTAMMPHPERAFLRWQFSWFPRDRKAPESPWLQLFRNARRWLESAGR